MAAPAGGFAQDQCEARDSRQWLGLPWSLMLSNAEDSWLLLWSQATLTTQAASSPVQSPQPALGSIPMCAELSG